MADIVRRPVPVAAFMADRGTIITILDDGSVWWTTQRDIQEFPYKADKIWVESAPIPKTVICYLREEEIDQG